MTHATARHRELDRRAAQAMGEAPGHALVRSRDRRKDMRTMTDRKPRVLLLEAEIRTSERTGRQWYSGWLGKARLIGFEADEPNDRGHRVIRFYAEEPEPRPAATQTKATTREPIPNSSALRRTGDRVRVERTSRRAQLDAEADEVASRYGAGEFSDEIPF